MIQLEQITLLPEEDETMLQVRACKKLGIGEKDLLELHILRQVLDARKKGNIFFRYTLAVKVKGEERLLRRLAGKQGISRYEKKTVSFPSGQAKSPLRPVVVGFGPAGLFASYVLAKAGLCPIVLERGGDVESRQQAVEAFWAGGKLSTENNVQFGEGGAGTFSDGKLTARTKDGRSRFVLETLVRFGAPEEILYSYRPHVGTDLLKDVVRRMREDIIKMGGEVHFFSKMTDFCLENGQVTGVQWNGRDWIKTQDLVLALGHSARDTFTLCYEKGLRMEQKPFAMGVRVEHLQKEIDRMQFGSFCEEKSLIPASYQLTAQTADGRGVYTFCMCPGGFVVNASSEEGRLAVNGMSYHARDGENANSALLVQVWPADFPSDHPLAGMEWQREVEEAAFLAGGGNGYAPAQRLGDFLADRPTVSFSRVKPTCRPGVQMCALSQVLPEVLVGALKEGILAMDHKWPGFAAEDAVLTAVESRSSSPVRLLRQKETLQAEGIGGLYPAGEGAGYAGGIVSAAVDGVRVAEKIWKSHLPKEMDGTKGGRGV